jgi:hypothetical protein
VLISGTARAQIVPNNLSTGALDYTNQSFKPIRHALVEVLDSATKSVLLGATETSETGHYSVAVQQNTNVIVRVKAQSQHTSAPSWNIMVRDNTNGNALYALDSAAFSTGSVNVTKDLNAGSGWNGTAYSRNRAAAPFAVLDTVYTAMAKARSSSGTAAFPDLNVYWSINNVATPNVDIPMGQISTTYFSFDGVDRAIYVLGKADNDTDEFDETVIAHEWGHYFQNVFSRDDSVGGRHGGDEQLDMRVAFSEGWGNAWSGIALNRNQYTDSSGLAQGQGYALALDQGPRRERGWYNEDSVQSVIFNLNQQVGFSPVWLGMTCQMPTGTPVSSIYSFAASVKSSSPASITPLITLLRGQSINGTDEWGNNETNTGGAGLSVPLYKQLVIGTSRKVCLSTEEDIDNRLGNYAFLWFDAPNSRNYTITATGGSFPDFDIYQQGYRGAATTLASGSASTNIRLIGNQAVVVLGDAGLVRGSSPCFNVLVQ